MSEPTDPVSTVGAVPTGRRRGRPVRRGLQLSLGCVVLGAGVALLLDSGLGSDGYSMLVHGLALATGTTFAVVNVVVGVVLVALAWARGTVPGLGTLAQPVLVGVTVAVLLPLLPTPEGSVARWAELLAGFALLCVGVAAYLAVELGAGPAEAAALAWDPPVPFRWSYSALQAGGAAIGWWGGAALGPGTVLVVLLVGPVVARLVPPFTPSRREWTAPDPR